MENLAYLYILAEEAEPPAQQSQIAEMPVPEKKHLWQRRSTPKTVTQAVDSVKTLDCDRASQSYPTFYL